MSYTLPVLNPKQLNPTRDYLRDVCLAMGSLQRCFLPPHPRDWQHGLEVTMRGVCTQQFEVSGQEVRVLLDFEKNQVRLEGAHWALGEHRGAEIFNNFKTWLQTKNINVKLEEPDFMGGKYDAEQTRLYAESLWWMHREFMRIKAELAGGLTSPVFIYPHHFDLSLVWFPHDNDTQIGIGYSTGDDIIEEPYIYMTLSPEPQPIDKSWLEKLPDEAHWQIDGFSGAVLPYATLQADPHPDELLRRFVGPFAAYAVANGL